MPRQFREFTGTDIIRIFNLNMRFEDQRICLLYFWSLMPKLRLKPQTSTFDVVLNILGAVPVVGAFTRGLQLTLNATNAILSIVDFFEAITSKDEDEEENKELVEAIEEANSLRDEISELIKERDGVLLDLIEADQEIITLEGIIDTLEAEKVLLNAEIIILERELQECRQQNPPIPPLEPPTNGQEIPQQPIPALNEIQFQVLFNLEGFLRALIAEPALTTFPNVLNAAQIALRNLIRAFRL